MLLHRTVLKVSLAVGLLASCADVDTTALGSVQQAAELAPLIQLSRPADGSIPTPVQLLGFTPDFSVDSVTSVNVPGFDSLNRPYIRNRSSDVHDIPGTLRTLRFGTWVEHGFESAVKRELGCSEPTDGSEGDGCKVCYERAGGEYNAQIVFDQKDNAYTVLHAAVVPTQASCPVRPSQGAYRLLMLHSDNYGQTWRAHTLPCAQQFALERPYSPEALHGPPALLLMHPETTYCGDGNGNGMLRVVKPYFTASGALAVGTPTTLLESGALNISSHSGGGTQLITHDERLYVVFGSRWEPETPDPVRTGSPVNLAVFNVEGPSLVQRERKQITVSRPTNDGHNRSALVLDTTGHIHVMVGAHESCSFRYLKSPRPYELGEADWAEPSTTFDGADIEGCDLDEDMRPEYVASQTYVSLVRDRFDTLHLAYRRHESGQGYFLTYQKKPVDGPWSSPRKLVGPPHSGYTTYYQQLTIDHYGRLYLTFNFYTYKGFTTNEPPGNWFAADELFKYSGLLTSLSGGNSWQYASTALFDEATAWEPASGAMGDLDGNGLADAVHAYWKHGLNVHIDKSTRSGSVWQGWTTRGARLLDGPQVLERPILVGNVNAQTDNRDDLVFAYAQPGTSQLMLRTHFARADGGFDGVSSLQADGIVPDVNHPIMIGDTTGDGKADLVLLSRRACGLRVYTKESLGDGTWATRTSACSSSDTSSIQQYPTRLGRVNDDPDDVELHDLVFMFRHPATNYLMTRVKLSNGDGTWTTLPDQSHGDGPGIHQYPHQLGDVNGDGLDDLVFLFRHWGTKQFSIRVKFANRDGTFGGSVETQHPDGSQVPHYGAMLAKVNDDACEDLVFPHRPDVDGDYRIRTFLSLCDGTKNAQWQRTTSRLP
jgi:hypothetical protein